VADQPKRRYPRADLRVQAKLSIANDARRRFEATLSTTNVSVGGLFLESTFFLKAGMELDIELTLPSDGPKVPPRVVRARGVIVRVEEPEEGRGRRGPARSGFAVRFTDYREGAQIALASYFLGPVLRRFIEEYAREHGMRATPEFLAQMVDVLAAWEVTRTEAPDAALWRGAPGKR
jgi:hypothetical protein